MPGTQHEVTLDEAQAFWRAQQPAAGAGIVIKAIGGGGGAACARCVGDELPAAYDTCRREGAGAFGVAGGTSSA